MLGPRHATLGNAVSIHHNHLWRRGVSVISAASAGVAATAAWSSALRLAAIGDRSGALTFAAQGAVAGMLALLIVVVLALRSLERVVVYERGLVHRGPWRSREVPFEQVREVAWVRDALGEHVDLVLEGGRELRLASVTDAPRLASLVRAACAR